VSETRNCAPNHRCSFNAERTIIIVPGPYRIIIIQMTPRVHVRCVHERGCRFQANKSDPFHSELYWKSSRRGAMPSLPLCLSASLCPPSQVRGFAANASGASPSSRIITRRSGLCLTESLVIENAPFLTMQQEMQPRSASSYSRARARD